MPETGCVNIYMPRPRTYNTLLRNGPTANEIRLPDGRVYNTAELQNRISRRRNHNLRTGHVTARAPEQPPNSLINFAACNIKYDLEDRVWQSEHTAEEIQQRYEIPTVRQAQSILYRARNIVQHLRDTGAIE